MLNSLILMFSQYEKNRTISNVFKIIWIGYVFVVEFCNFNFLFFILSINAFILTTGVTYYVGKIFLSLKVVLSCFSILTYSFFIDVLCYYVLPDLTLGQSLIDYIINGFLFNYKYVLLNIILFILVSLHSKVLKAIRLCNSSQPQF